MFFLYFKKELFSIYKLTNINTTMNKTISFNPDFQDISMYKILENIPNLSELSIHKELYLTRFVELYTKYIPEFSTSERIQYTEFSDEKGILKPFYTSSLVLGKNIAIMYQSSDFTNNDEEEQEDDDDLGLDLILTLDGPKIKKSNNDLAVSDVEIYYNSESKDIINNILSEINTCIYDKNETNLFYTIGVGSYGFTLNKQEANSVELDIELNYGNKFLPVYDQLVTDLTTKYHGLVLLHGEPGTGKTTMIRHLISKLCNTKKIIYIPAFMIEQIANPEFITFIQKHKESILILEDAEFALQLRNEEYGAQAVSNLLNITNGLLNDAIKIQVIATFNMDKKNIDPALLRPGRLLNEWKFDKLSIEESINLAKSINKNTDITTPMTIAEIYNETVNKNAKKSKKKIGF